MTRFSIFGYYGQGNAGDEAILAALIDGIKTELPKAHISVCSANPEDTKIEHRINAFPYFGIDLKSIIKGVLGKNRKSYLNAIISFFRSDVIVIGGGGLFFDNPETNRWFFGYIRLIHRAKRFGKKVALVGISVGPLHHKSSEEAIKQTFALVDLISVRDNTSRDTLIRCGVAPDKIHVIPDLVFTLNSASDERIAEILAHESFPTQGSRNIALTPCCYNIKQSGWIEQYVAFCERATTELDCNLWLIPMQRNNNHDDLSAIESIYSKLSPDTKSRTHKLFGRYSAKEIQGIISKADFVLAERLHGSIMAINTNTPVMSIAYMPKVNGVLELAKLTDRLIPMNNFIDGNFLIASQFQSKENFNCFIAGTEDQLSETKNHATSNFSMVVKITPQR
ncbi:polysaccharide pyruvyl transferase family protein [Cellvibrio sp. OA-2007]|uniref:polysaccharide pyruvyl transferase family protein n=1 Tax=Cellvibrio sp. OA-2007 TaxID=529823 RepID=UPI0007833601|nr:polysaccharide pyruvyl transferase family protein [Cellvibrio sp. OA-2007]